MPNLLAHVFLGLVLSRLSSGNGKSMIVFGSILPDIKIFVYAIATPTLGLAEANALILPIHSPLGSLLLCAFFASLLPEKGFTEALFFLALGVSGHYLLDAAMFPVNGIEHYLLLYPLSWEPYGIETGHLTDYFTILGLIVLTTAYLKKKRVFPSADSP